MEKEYSISVGTKTFYGILAFVIFVFSIFLLTISNSKKITLILIPLIFLIISALIVINFIKRKILITEKSILCVNLFSTRALNISEIKGYRLDGKIIKIEPISENDKTITISNFIDFEYNEEILKWLIDNFKDLDASDLEIEHQKILKDTSLGYSENEREEKIKLAKNITNGYNSIGVILGLVMVFIKIKYSSIIILVIPLIGILILYNFELIKFISNKKRSVYSHVFIGVFTSCIFLTLKSFEFNLLDLKNLWIPSIGIGLLIFVLLYLKGINRSVESVIGQLVLMFIVSIAFGFGSIKVINCEFDQSQETLYTATVIDHHITHGKRTNYYIKLSTWGPQNKEKNESVSRTMYENTFIGDRVDVKYKQGLFKIPWFKISSKYIINYP